MTGLLASRLDPIFKLPQVDPFDVGPDHPRRMIFSDQAVDIHRPQLNLIAPGLAQPRRSRKRHIGSRLALLGKFSKQLVFGHLQAPQINPCRESYRHQIGYIPR